VFESNEWCFVCETGKFTTKLLSAFPATKEFEGSLPVDFEEVYPPTAMGWFQCVGLSFLNTKGMGYSQKNQAVVIPMHDYNTKKLVGYQLRYVLPGAKYKAFNVGATAPVLFKAEFSTSPDTIVLCEDVRSALKVSALYNSVALMGTFASRRFLDDIASDYKKIYIWLDGDEAGTKAANKLFRKLQLIANVKLIKTDKDPKYYPLSVIIQLIEGK
jgi:DNA primase